MVSIVPPMQILRAECCGSTQQVQSIPISVLTFQVRAREKESGIWNKGQARGGKGRKRKRPEHSAADAFTHRPAPFTCWCDMEVAESCEKEMCMRDGARPGLRGRREGGREGGREERDTG